VSCNGGDRRGRQERLCRDELTGRLEGTRLLEEFLYVYHGHSMTHGDESSPCPPNQSARDKPVW
jgi:hypothetical protein